MSTEDQELQERVARLEKELAEIKLLLTPKEATDPWAPRISQKAEPIVPVVSPEAKDREKLRTRPTPPPVLQANEPADRVGVDAFGVKPKASQPDQVRISSKPSAPEWKPVPPKTEAPDGMTRSEEVEFKIGGRYLAFAGGIVVLLGMLYLVTLALSNRWISLEMQWGGELVFCAILAGLGLWKLNNKEIVGQVLVGTGSCGAFLSFAGAHLFKGILSLDGLIVACVCLSLLNFAFSEWRKSQVFFVFGMLGGFIASALPQTDRVALSQILQAVVLAPAVIVVVRRKWMGMAYLLWPTAVAFGFHTLSGIEGANFYLPKLLAGTYPANAFPPGSPFSWGYWAAFSLFGLAASAAYLLVHEKHPQEPAPLLAWVGPFFFTLLPFALLPELAKPWGFAATLAVCLAHLALSRVAASEEAKWGQTIGAIAAGLIVPAFSLTFAQASGVYALETLALALWWLRAREASVLSLGIATGMLGWFSALPAIFNDLVVQATIWQQMLAIAPCLTIAVAGAIFIWKPADFFTPNTRSFLFFGSASALALGLVQLLVNLGIKDSGTYTWAMLATLGVLAIASWFDKTKDAVAGQIVFSLLGLIGVIITLSQSVTRVDEVAQNAFLLFTMVTCMIVYSSLDEKRAGGAAVMTSMAAVYPFARLVYLAAVNMGADTRSALLIGLALYALSVSMIGRFMKWKDLVGTAGVYACAMIVPYSSSLGGVKPLPLLAGFESAGLLIAMGAIVVMVLSYGDLLPTEKSAFTGFGIVAFSIPAARLAWIIMSQPWLNLQLAQAMLLFLALYSAALAVFAHSKKSVLISWIAAFYFCLGLGAYPVMKMPAWFNLPLPNLTGGAMADAAALAALLAASLVTCKALLAASQEKNTVLVPFLAADWALFSGFVMILAQQPPLGIKFDFSMSAAWVLYGVILLVIGFVQDKAVFRISGLVVFSATLCKVFLYDLSYLETVIKIILFISFGVVMLAISYAYTWFSRTHRKTDAPSSPDLQ